jgi:alanyl-tRNA synthetase
LQGVLAQARKLAKATYLFSIDGEGGKVAHANYVPPQLKSKGADARTWAVKVTEVLGGKVCSIEELVGTDLTVNRPGEKRIALKE